MKIATIYNEIEKNTFTGEGEEVITYAINCKYGYIELQTRNTTMNGIATVQAADVETTEKIYNHFEELGNYELYLDNAGAYTYIDITTWDNPADLETIKNEVINVLKK